MPIRVECIVASSENLDHTVYIFKVFTPDGRCWAISKRFSDFDNLRSDLVADGNPAVKSLSSFPSKSWNPFSPVDDSVVTERKQQLQVIPSRIFFARSCLERLGSCSET